MEAVEVQSGRRDCSLRDAQLNTLRQINFPPPGSSTIYGSVAAQVGPNLCSDILVVLIKVEIQLKPRLTFPHVIQARRPTFRRRGQSTPQPWRRTSETPQHD